MNTQQLAEIYVYLGGTRSGKSRCAERKVQELAEGPVLYVATAQDIDAEGAMQQRIARHKHRRPETWQLLECPLHLSVGIETWLKQYAADIATTEASVEAKRPTVLVDCVTLWVNNMLFFLGQEHGPQDSMDGHEGPCVRALEDMVRSQISDVLTMAMKYGLRMVFVSGETGLGGIGATSLERIFHDGLGLANELLVAQSQEAYFVVAGRSITL